jgi:hypothetical protein
MRIALDMAIDHVRAYAVTDGTDEAEGTVGA